MKGKAIQAKLLETLLYLDMVDVVKLHSWNQHSWQQG